MRGMQVRLGMEVCGQARRFARLLAEPGDGVVDRRCCRDSTEASTEEEDRVEAIQWV